MSFQPQPIEGLRVPLFDRLVDSAPADRKELSPVRLHNRTALYVSMARDISRLLNTRRSSGMTLNPATATVLDYGIPSFSHLSAASVTDRRLLTETIRAAIAFFEPRAQDVVVELAPDPLHPASLTGHVHCKAKLHRFLEPVTFPLILRQREGTAEVLVPESNAAATTAAADRIDVPHHG